MLLNVFLSFSKRRTAKMQIAEPALGDGHTKRQFRRTSVWGKRGAEEGGKAGRILQVLSSAFCYRIYWAC